MDNVTISHMAGLPMRKPGIRPTLAFAFLGLSLRQRFLEPHGTEDGPGGSRHHPTALTLISRTVGASSVRAC
jgi:hypothetical protein